MHTLQKTKLAILKDLLNRGGYTEKGPFLLNPNKVYHFSLDTRQNVVAVAKYLYLKEDIPFVATQNYDEVSVDVLNNADVKELIEAVENINLKI